jgi:peroxiredoxin
MEPDAKWPRVVLRLAAIYNLCWGAWVILFPNHLFQWTGIQPPNYPGIWQCVGMIVGVYGIGYWIAGEDYRVHWPIVLVGFLGKLFGPIGFLQTALSGGLPWAWGWTIVTNDLIWWIPFASMLYLAFKYHNQPTVRFRVHDSPPELPTPVVSNGLSLVELSSDKPVLLVFLRYSGCTFCRENLVRLAKLRSELLSMGIRPVVVHMSTPEDGQKMLDAFGLAELVHISDPGCVLYQKYQLARGKLGQLFGPAVWWKGFLAAIYYRYGFGKLSGDGFQLGGSVLLRRGEVVKAFPGRDASATIPEPSQLSTADVCKL